jgi:hypothetical protein
MGHTAVSGASVSKSYAKKAKEPRVPKQIRVVVEGIDSNGNPFKQRVQTINISRTGARVDGPCCLRGPGEVVVVKRHWKKAKFRVVWMGQIGTPEACHVGICLLEPKKKMW